MELPANVKVASPALTTNAVANTPTNATEVAAPGANLRIRLWGYVVTCDNTTQAPVNWFVKLTDGSGGTAIGGVSAASFLAPPAVWIPGGYAITINTLLGLTHSSALASLALRPIVWYTVEATA